MLTTIETPDLHVLGAVGMHAFGLLVAMGVFLGAKLIQWNAKKAGLPAEKVTGLIWWTCVSGFAWSHVFEILFYQADRLVAEGPLLLLEVWDGISSYGGFLGAVFGFWFYVSRHIKQGAMVYCDLLVQGLTLGWIFGRLGCTLTFDHPGARSDFFLAFEWAGGARHNLGFYELLLTALLIFPATLLVQHLALPAGSITAVVALLYAPPRFFLDFLRSTDLKSSDTRHWGLTFAQYCSVALLVYGLFLVAKIRKQSATAPG